MAEAGSTSGRHALPLASVSVVGGLIAAFLMPVLCPVAAAIGGWSLRFRCGRRPRLTRALGLAGLLIGLLGSVPLLGIKVPPAAADSHARANPINIDLVTGSVVRIELLRFNGADVPPAVWQRVVDRFAQHVSGDVVVTDHGMIHVPLEDDGTLPSAFWPMQDDDGPVTVQRLLDEARQWVALDSYGLAGARLGAYPMRSGGEERFWIEPCVEPATILVAVVPVVRDVRQLTGWMQSVCMLETDGSPADRHGAMAVIQVDIINREAMIAPAQRRLLEWTLFHELGHALGVPSDAARIRYTGGGHCVRPECVMYSPGDWRFVLSMYLNGWAMDLCSACADELAAARSYDDERLRQHHDTR